MAALMFWMGMAVSTFSPRSGTRRQQELHEKLNRAQPQVQQVVKTGAQAGEEANHKQIGWIRQIQMWKWGRGVTFNQILECD